MSNFRIRTTGEVVSQGELRRRNSEVSLPSQWNSDTLDFLGIDAVFETPSPEVTELQIAVQDGVVKDSKDNWTIAWKIVDRFQDQVDAEGTVIKSKADQEAEFYAQKLEQAKTSLEQAVQSHLDSTAKSFGYDSILSMCTYATSDKPKFYAEGQAAVKFRDDCWLASYEVMVAVQAGTLPVPTTEELIAGLPAINVVQ